MGSGVCDKPHHSMLHGSGNAYCQANHVLSTSVMPKDELILLGVKRVQALTSQDRQSGILFYDSGSTLTLRLTGKPFCPSCTLTSISRRKRQAAVLSWSGRLQGCQVRGFHP